MVLWEALTTAPVMQLTVRSGRSVTSASPASPSASPASESSGSPQKSSSGAWNWAMLPSDSSAASLCADDIVPC